MFKRILVFGAGAVGGYVGGHLLRAGHDVTFADFWPEHVEAMRSDGLKLTGMTEAEAAHVHPRALHLTELQGLIKEAPIDLVLLSVKSYDTDWAARLAALYLVDDGPMVSLQNGINEPTIAEVVGAERTMGCIASKIVVELVAPGVIERRVALGGAAHTVFRVGEFSGPVRERTTWLAEALSVIDSAKASDNLGGERWSKLVANAMSNCVSAATALPVKAYTLEDSPRRISIRLAGEAVQVGLALGHTLEKINGMAPEAWVVAAEALKAGANESPELAEVEAKMLASIARISDTARPSMAQDVAKGRRTEIDNLNGLVVRRGKEVGIETPVNAAMVEAVRRVERGAADPALALLPAL